MFRSRLEPLSPETRELFAKERQYPAQPSQLRARALLRARMTAFRTKPPARSISRRPAWLLLAAAPLVVFAALALASFRAERSVAPRSVQLPPAGTRVAPLPSPSTLSAGPLATAPASEELSPPRVASAKRRPTAAVDAEAVELRLLQRARAAVASGQFSTALAVIADYERRFPAGLLREECEALRIKSLTGLGRTEQADRATEGFRERFPRSVLLRRTEEPANRPQ